MPVVWHKLTMMLANERRLGTAFLVISACCCSSFSSGAVAVVSASSSSSPSPAFGADSGFWVLNRIGSSDGHPAVGAQATFCGGLVCEAEAFGCRAGARRHPCRVACGSWILCANAGDGHMLGLLRHDQLHTAEQQRELATGPAALVSGWDPLQAG